MQPHQRQQAAPPAPVRKEGAGGRFGIAITLWCRVRQPQVDLRRPRRQLPEGRHPLPDLLRRGQHRAQCAHAAGIGQCRRQQYRAGTGHGACSTGRPTPKRWPKDATRCPMAGFMAQPVAVASHPGAGNRARDRCSLLRMRRVDGINGTAGRPSCPSRPSCRASSASCPSCRRRPSCSSSFPSACTASSDG